MKKSFLFISLVCACLLFTGCNKFKILDGDRMERSAEEICLYFDGQVSETEDGEAICILPNDEFCYMYDIEDGGCDLLGYEGDAPTSVVCEENGGNFQVWLEGGEEQNVCVFDDESFCYLQELIDGVCKEGDMYYDEDGIEEYDAIYESCMSAGEDLVCGQDGNTYFNRCVMQLNGVEEETEMAEIIDGECVFG